MPRTQRTYLAVPYCSNGLVHVNPVAEMAAKGESGGGVSYGSDGLPDVKALGVDIYLLL